jgi:hypothetical protein
VCFFSNFLGSEEKIQFDMRDVTKLQLSSKVIYDALEFEVRKKVHVFASFSSQKRKECYELCKKMVPESSGDLSSSEEEEEEKDAGEGDEDSEEGKQSSLEKKKQERSPSSSPSRTASPSHKDNENNSNVAVDEKLPSSWRTKFESMKLVADVSICLDLHAVFDLLLADNAKCSCVYLSKHSPNGGESEHKLTSWVDVNDDDDVKDDDDNNNNNEKKKSHFESSTRYTQKRKFEFRKKLSQPIGPSETTVYQNHRYGFFDMDGATCVAFESCVSTPDVPYGSYFLVRIKYLLLSESISSTRFKVAVCVDMLKSTMWSGTILSLSLSLSLSTNTTLTHTQIYRDDQECDLEGDKKSMGRLDTSNCCKIR